MICQAKRPRAGTVGSDPNFWPGIPREYGWGRLQAKQVLIPDVVLGVKNEAPSVFFVNSPPPDTLPGIDGVVGLTALRARRVYFDLVGKTVSWE
jgi:hypothetical protein